MQKPKLADVIFGASLRIGKSTLEPPKKPALSPELPEQNTMSQNTMSQTYDTEDEGSSLTANEQYPVKKTPNRKRTRQVSIRFSDAEYQRFEHKLKKSGLTQSNYIRHMTLEGRVVSAASSIKDGFVLEEIAEVRSQIHQLLVLLKLFRNAVESGHIESKDFEQWILDASRSMESLRGCVLELEAKLNGNHRA